MARLSASSMYGRSAPIGSGVMMAPVGVLVWIMSELIKSPRGSVQKYRLQSFWEYLEGYSMAFDMFPDYGRPHPSRQDVYRTVKDYYAASDDLIRVIKVREAAVIEEAKRSDGARARAQKTSCTGRDAA